MTPAEQIPQIADTHGLNGRRAARRMHTGTGPALEREIERLHARVAELEHEKAELEAFAAVAAHELVEPLVMTEAYAAMIGDQLDEDLFPEAREDLEAMARGAARTRLLAETLLHDARSGGRHLERRPVDLNAVVRDSLTLLRPEIRARGAVIEIDELPEVLGDEALLGGVFTNLLINALKYSPRRETIIRVTVAAHGADWLFEVESGGRTIAPQDRLRIFEPFRRGPGERRTRGAGLGLAICRRIVERHGGQIGVTAADGPGNRFFFTLPAD
jgi:light-regulated signal transduction histidine kinase (bacteriophytochrome)